MPSLTITPLPPEVCRQAVHLYYRAQARDAALTARLAASEEHHAYLVKRLEDSGLYPSMGVARYLDGSGQRTANSDPIARSAFLHDRLLQPLLDALGRCEEHMARLSEERATVRAEQAVVQLALSRLAPFDRTLLGEHIGRHKRVTDLALSRQMPHRTISDQLARALGRLGEALAVVGYQLRQEGTGEPHTE